MEVDNYGIAKNVGKVNLIFKKIRFFKLKNRKMAIILVFFLLKEKCIKY